MIQGVLQLSERDPAPSFCNVHFNETMKLSCPTFEESGLYYSHLRDGLFSVQVLAWLYVTWKFFFIEMRFSIIIALSKPQTQNITE